MDTKYWGMRLLLLVSFSTTVSHAADPVADASPEQLRRWLQQYPQADANGDGVLTVDEAQVYRRKLERERAADPSPGFQHEYAFATMSDGVQIALAIGYPRGFDPADQNRKWPAIFRTCGYPSVTAPADPREYGQRCVTVQASIRGTGASGGELSP